MQATTMIDAHIHADSTGTILYDAATAPQLEHAWFEPEHWRAAGLLRGHGGGRGSVCFVDTPVGACVLRHYHRGGMVAALLGDRYLWSGREQTRGFAEFRLTAALAERGLPVPIPLATRYRRRGIYYSADLITRRIEDASTLGDCLHDGRLDASLAEATGALIARFHRDGVWHADLNAHNVMVGAEQIYLIDFDRGELRPPARSWQQANLQRLRRSLLKLGAASSGEHAFEQTIWMPLMRGYERGPQA